MLVMTRFRIPLPESDAFRAAVEDAHAVLSQQPGYVGGGIGRNVDDPELWLLQTSWEGPGAYRRALSAYEVKVRAWALLGRALDEPNAYEAVTVSGELNTARPRRSN